MSSNTGPGHGAMSQSFAGPRTAETTIRACDSRARKRVVYESKTNRLRVVLPLPTLPSSASEDTGSGTSLSSQHWPIYVGHYVLYYEGLSHSVYMYLPIISRIRYNIVCTVRSEYTIPVEHGPLYYGHCTLCRDGKNLKSFNLKL